MADPITWMIIAGAVLAVAGATTATAISAHSNNKQREFQQDVLDKKRKIAEQNAALVRKQAKTKAWETKQQAHRQRASQLVQMAGSGAVVSGNFLDIIGESSARQEYDILNVEYEGELQARQHLINAEGAQDQIGLLEIQKQDVLLESAIAGGTQAGMSMFTMAAGGGLPSSGESSMGSSVMSSGGYTGTMGGLA